VGAFTTVDAPETARGLQRIHGALSLIKTHAPNTYNRLRRDLKRIWMRVLPGPNGTFYGPLLTCALDERFVLRPETTLELLAATIVHEATHARLDGCQIDYSSLAVRGRVEAVCRKQELAFAARLPNGNAVRERADQALARPESDWTDEAYHERFVEGAREAFTHMHLPGWLFRLVSRPWRRRQ
jgi:hypothetical protein